MSTKKRALNNLPLGTLIPLSVRVIFIKRTTETEKVPELNFHLTKKTQKMDN